MVGGTSETSPYMVSSLNQNMKYSFLRGRIWLQEREMVANNLFPRDLWMVTFKVFPGDN